MPLIWYVYMGRIFALMIYVVLAGWAIKILPSGKWFLVVVALLPTSLTQASIVGTDGLVNGLSWLIIAITLAVFANKVSLDFRKLILISAACLWLCLIKDGYWLIAALPLIIPIKYFKKPIIGWLWRVADVAVIGAASIIFAIRTRRVAATTVLTPVLNTYINSKAQFHYVEHHILLFSARALAQPFTKNYDTVYESLVGVVTNRLIYLSLPIMGLLYLMLFLSAYDIRTLPSLIKYKKRLWSAAIIVTLGTYLLVSLALYVGITQVGASDVFGIYGRYFLPLLPLIIVFPMLSRSRLRLQPTTVVGSIMIVVFLSLTSTLLSIG